MSQNDNNDLLAVAEEFRAAAWERLPFSCGPWSLALALPAQGHGLLAYCPTGPTGWPSGVESEKKNQCKEAKRSNKSKTKEKEAPGSFKRAVPTITRACPRN